MIDSLRVDYSITELGDALDVSPSGYYAARRRTPSPRRPAKRLLGTILPGFALHHAFCPATLQPRRKRKLLLVNKNIMVFGLGLQYKIL